MVSGPPDVLCEDTEELDGNQQDFQKRGESNEHAVFQHLYKDLVCEALHTGRDHNHVSDSRR